MSKILPTKFFVVFIFHENFKDFVQLPLFLTFFTQKFCCSMIFINATVKQEMLLKQCKKVLFNSRFVSTEHTAKIKVSLYSKA